MLGNEVGDMQRLESGQQPGLRGTSFPFKSVKQDIESVEQSLYH